MAKIHSISIKNFRGLKFFEETFKSNFVCIIGRGDSCKSTILEAISCVLSPAWNLSFHDNDFYKCNTDNPIEIEATVKDLPPALIKESKFGLYVRGIHPVSAKIEDELEDDYHIALTIKLIINRDLEPKWFVTNKRQTEPKLISANDRATINMFMVSDYVDRHFSWNKGNPLYSLLKRELSQEDELEEDQDVVIEAMREAKMTIDNHRFSKFDNVTKLVKSSTLKLGMDITNTKSTIDFKDINIKDGKLCLHDDQVPFRMKGKGSKRLISIGIQTAIADQGGIILIDEIEQGLEPDRARHLAAILKSMANGQIFITTHSRDVLVELTTENLFLMKLGADKFVGFDASLQGCLRRNPEAFFAHKVVICEGPTEVGICRALNNYRIANGKVNAAFLGVHFADGTGNQMLTYSKGFKVSGFPVCLFCDSDDKTVNPDKAGLKSLGVEVVDWEEMDCLEVAIFKYLQFNQTKALIKLASKIEHEEDSSSTTEQLEAIIWDSIKANFNSLSRDVFDTEKDSVELRIAMGLSANKKKWFKTHSKGEILGNFILAHYDQISEQKLKMRLDAISTFIG